MKVTDSFRYSIEQQLILFPIPTSKRVVLRCTLYPSYRVSAQYSDIALPSMHVVRCVNQIVCEDGMHV